MLWISMFTAMRADLIFDAEDPANKYMVIGSVWLAKDDRERLKSEIHALRDKHHIGGEFKWQKVSKSRLEFYLELIDWFFDRGDAIRFRCIAVDHAQANMIKYHENDQELAFYKFYYQMLHHWLLDFNVYCIFCDLKANRKKDRLPVLRRCLACANLSSSVNNVQATRSRESVLLQLADVITGAAAARLNNTISQGGAKEKVVEKIEFSTQSTSNRAHIPGRAEIQCIRHQPARGLVNGYATPSAAPG